MVGLVTGLVVAVMSFTGVLIAFETEILEWLDRDVRQLTLAEGESVLPLAVLLDKLSEAGEGAALTGLTVYADPLAAWQAHYGRDEALYVDPFKGEWKRKPSGPAHAWFHRMTEWHRWLGMKGSGRATGRAITGACNLGFLFLLLSGWILWVPRKWTRRHFKPVLALKLRARGRVRDWNWHHVLGFWSAPFLLVLVGTGVVISYSWAGNLVYRLAGEEPPPSRRGPPGTMAAIQVEPPAVGAQALAAEVQLEGVGAAFPDWKEMTVRWANGDSAQPDAATLVTVRRGNERPRFATTQVVVDPYRGAILSISGYGEMSSGRKSRMWLRYLHTGEAFGIWGKALAALASFIALVLVWTGFALSWRRFLGSGGGSKKAALKV